VRVGLVDDDPESAALVVNEGMERIADWLFPEDAIEAWADSGIRLLEDYLLVVAAFQAQYPETEE
jgi:hypothetical protein